MGIDIGFIQSMMSNHTSEYFFYLSSFILTMWFCVQCAKFKCPRRRTRTNMWRFIQRNLRYWYFKGSDLISNIDERIGINVYKVYDKTKLGAKLLICHSISMIFPFLNCGRRLCFQVSRFHNKHFAMHMKTRKKKLSGIDFSFLWLFLKPELAST